MAEDHDVKATSEATHLNAYSKLRTTYDLQQLSRHLDDLATRPKAVTLTIAMCETISKAERPEKRRRLVGRHRLISLQDHEETFYGVTVQMDPAQLKPFLHDAETDEDIAWMKFER